MADQKWRSYEEVARYLLDQFAEQFGLERVEEKQKIVGVRSGRKIEIDGKGVKQGNTGFVLIEYKCYAQDRVEAEKLEALAYRILDAGAEGGIIVSPIGVQDGAEKIAQAENVMHVCLNENCTKYAYVLKFLNQVMIGIHDVAGGSETVNVKVEEAADGGG
jgi:hypothetical protein